MTRRVFDIGAPSTVTHDSAVGSYSLAWETLSGVSIPDEYLSVIGDAFLRLLRLEYNPNGVGGSSTYTSLAQFQTATTDSGTGSSSSPQMATSWEKRDVAFTIIVGGNRYNVLGPDAAGVPSASDDFSEPYYWRFTTPSLQALTRAVQEADAATRAAIQLELDTGLADGVVLLTARGASTWTVPAGITAIKVELVGAGGGGGGFQDSGTGRSGRKTVFGLFQADNGRGGGAYRTISSGGRILGEGGRGGGVLSGISTANLIRGNAGTPGIEDSTFVTGARGRGGLSGARDVSGLAIYGKGGVGGYQSFFDGGSGGGGGGSYDFKDNLQVTPGDVISYTVGAGGAIGSGLRANDRGQPGTSGAIRITYDPAVAPSFADDTEDAQSWVRNTVISSISIPRVAQGFLPQLTHPVEYRWV